MPMSRSLAGDARLAATPNDFAVRAVPRLMSPKAATEICPSGVIRLGHEL
jgi:hypothetical protein